MRCRRLVDLMGCHRQADTVRCRRRADVADHRLRVRVACRHGAGVVRVGEGPVPYRWVPRRRAVVLREARRFRRGQKAASEGAGPLELLVLALPGLRRWEPARPGFRRVRRPLRRARAHAGADGVRASVQLVQKRAVCPTLAAPRLVWAAH
jgi:hypothetical protein